MSVIPCHERSNPAAVGTSASRPAEPLSIPVQGMFNWAHWRTSFRFCSMAPSWEPPSVALDAMRGKRARQARETPFAISTAAAPPCAMHIGDLPPTGTGQTGHPIEGCPVVRRVFALVRFTVRRCPLDLW